MQPKRVGIVNVPGTPDMIVQGIKTLEEAGVPAVWLTTGAPGPDALSIFSAAASITDTIKMGTAVTPTWPQHPIYSVQQLQVIDSLAPGRFRFGVGPSGMKGMTKTFGANFFKPVTNMREFIHVTKSLMQEGKVDFNGIHYKANAQIQNPSRSVPIMGSALGRGAFEVCGEVSDGAISWVCPGTYLRDVGVPALKEGAQKAGRPTPPLIAHFIACIHEDLNQVRAAVRQDFGYFATSEFYIRMFAAAGFPEIQTTKEWSDDLIDAVTFSGDQDALGARIQKLFEWGATEVYASIVTAGRNPEVSRERTISALSDINRKLR